MRLLVVEDERRLAGRLAKGLREEGFAVDHAPALAAAREHAIACDYDLLLLDLGLPDGCALDLVREWRSEGCSSPILLLTARDRVEDKVEGLDAGADDYLTKPFEFDELLARIRALLRRPVAPPRRSLRFADVELDRTARAASRAGHPLDLTGKELALLEHFLLHPGVALSRGDIAEHVWDSTYEARSNVIDVIVGRLRRKLESRDGERLIHTLPGHGWILRRDGPAG